MLGRANFYQTRLLCLSCFHEQKISSFWTRSMPCAPSLLTKLYIQRARPSNPYIEVYGWALTDGVDVDRLRTNLSVVILSDVPQSFLQ